MHDNIIDVKSANAVTAFCGFVKRLAAAWQCADEENSARIEAAWPDYIAKYRQLADTMPKDADLTTAKPALDK